MNKAELVEYIYEHGNVGESKAAAERALVAVLDAVKAGLAGKEGTVQLIGFGSFNVKKRKARTGRNPRTGEKIKIKASKTVSFRPGKGLKEAI
ncbi:MAG: HU family DNA-binding protein [Planctomycetota bacterium]|nr:HU family DNA-binding protein [Planctomycetota bacterium]